MSILSSLNKPRAKATETLTLTSIPFAVDNWLEAKEAEKEAKAQLEVAASLLTEPVRQAWFDGNAGRAVPASSVLCNGSKGAALVSFAGVYKQGSEEIPAHMRRRKFSLTVDGDAVPAEKAEAFAEALVELAERFGCREAVSAKVIDNYPSGDFGVRRHTELTPSENMALEAAGLGTRVSIRVK